jgi:hypothetical protein
MRDVDDLALLLLEHDLAGELAEAKDAREVDLDDDVPVGLGIVDRGRATDEACVVDEDVDAAELLEGRVDDMRSRALVGEIGGDRERLSS